MRRAKWPRGDNRLAVECTHDAMNFCRLQRLSKGEIGENRRQALCQHGFSRTGRADEDDVMAAGGGDFESALDVLLPFDVVEVGVVLRVLIEQFVEVDGGG